jgi:DHA2 family multidrug resistance protein
MQANLGYTATTAGLAACPHAIVIILMAPIVQKLMPKVDNRLLICAGLLLLAAATAWKTTYASNVTFWTLFFVQGSMGIGLALMFLPIVPAVLGTLKPQDVAAGAGLMNFCRTTAMAFGAAIVTTSWNDKATENRVALINQMSGTDAIASLGLPKAQQPFLLDALVQEQSVMLATVQIYGVLVVIMLVAAMSIWLIPRPPSGNAVPTGGH